MVLCFGAYAAILMKCALPGTTNRVMVSTLVGTIDAGNRYGDKANDTSVSRLMNCAGNFPSIQVESTDGPIRSIVGAQTNAVALARSASTAALAEKFGPVMDLLDEDKKKSAVGALLKLISSDASLAENHRAMFIRCMGGVVDNIIEEKEVNLPVFLAGLFLYTVLTNENTRGKETLKVIKSDAFWEGLRSVSLRSGAAADLPAGHRGYMDRLYEKYNRIPTILYKEALTPFRDYYVPNNIEYRVPDPNKRHTYRVAQINGVTISRLLEISRYLVLSGTGGLGKSMMMRYLTLSMIDCFDRLGLIPFFIPLKDFETEFDSMLEYVFDVTRNLWPELTITQLDALLQKGCALLLFDGLDEIHTSKLGDFTKKMNAFQDRYPDNAFVISSRPYSNFQSFARSTVLQLQPFTKPQALELVDRYNYRADAPKLQARFRSQLDHELYRTHAGFSDNPLLLSIMMLTFEMDAEVPTVKYLFYQEAYTVLSRRHDAMKDGYTRRLATGWTANQFADYFAFFCAMKSSQFIKYLAADGLYIIVVHAPQRDIQCVSSDVDQGTAALQSLVREYTPGRNSSSSEGVCFCEIDIAKLTSFTGSMQSLGVVSQTVLIADGKFLAGFFPCVDHLLGIFGVVSHGLLAHNMLAGFKSSHGDRAVCYVRSTNMNNIHVRIIYQIMVVGVHLCVLGAIVSFCFYRTLFDNVAECHDLVQIGIGLQRGHMLLISDTTTTYDTYTNFCHFFVTSCFFF